MATKLEVDTDIENMLQSITEKEKVYSLLLFNDDDHDMLEVLLQIIKAIKCAPDKAERIMFQAHSAGQAEVMSGGLSDCKKAQAILEEIKLGTDIVEV
jgi:ATP-dependent Clp protease adapter protein ClpS